MRAFFTLAVRTQLFLLAFIVALPAGTIIIWTGVRAREAAIEDAKRESQRLADSIAAENQNLVAGARQLVIALAQLPEVKRKDAERVQPVLQDILKLNTQFSNIFIADVRGRVWASAVPQLLGQDVSDRRYFNNALASGELSSGEYVISRATTKPAFNIANPLRDDQGGVIGVISVGFVLDTYRQVMERLELPSGTSFILLDHRGLVLYRPFSPEAYIGRQYDATLFEQMQRGPDVYTYAAIASMSGDQRIVTYRKLQLPAEPEPYMYVRAGIPLDVVLSASRRSLVANLGLLSSALILAVALAWLIAKRSIADRITLLENATRALARGDLGVRVSELVSGGELGELSETFDAMAAQLSEREKALLESEKSYHTIFNATEEAIFVHDAVTGEIVEVNRAAAELWGYAADEFAELSVGDLSGGTTPQATDDALGRIRQAATVGPQRFEWLAKKRGGELFWTEVVLTTTSLAGRDLVVAVVRDVSDQRRAAEVLRENEERLRAAINVAQIGIFDFGPRTGAMYWSPQLRVINGVEPDEAVSLQTFVDLVHPADRELVGRDIAQSQDPNGPGIADMQPRIIRRDGTTRWLRVRSQTVFEGAGAARHAARIVGAVLDITAQKAAEEERSRLQAQLLQAQKIESVGQLAGGIAHDFNNILAAIIGFGDLLGRELAADDPVHLHLDQIMTAAKRAANLTQSLLAFSRKQVIDPKDVDLNDSIRKVERLLSRVIGEDVELRISLSPEPLTVFADPSQLEQVLMNLATNARDAMPTGGKLVIETSRVELGDDFVDRHGFGGRGPHVLLALSDTGTGMDEEVRQKIFEPFFTTKELGRGTGLGLSIVYGIVKQNKGHITVYSEVGRGTTFRIYLPLRSRTAVAAVTPPAPGALAPRRGTETILLTEDNDLVRRMTKTALERFGYSVIEAADGDEALARFAENRERVDLLLLDVIMPRRNGREVYREALRQRPGVKALFTSGYPSDLVQREGVLEPGLDFLSKPVAVAELLRKVREILDR
jgi:PAS domain S-box-containing protein